MPGNGNGNGYGGDEETTPPNAVAFFSAEARELVNLALAIGATAASVWRVARLLDSVDGDARELAIARAASELSEIVDAATTARTAITAINRGKR